MSYDKYIKIKQDTSGSHGNGIKRATNYINDDEKTVYSIDKAISYVENEAKTLSPDNYKRLVSGWNCDPDTAPEEFQMVEKRYHAIKQEHLNPGQKANEAFHFISSYQGRNLDPELVHHLGLELCKRILGDEFQAIVCTHLNTNNYHNHILVNAYSLTKAAKFKDEYHLYKRIREVTNELSLEYGLSVIMNSDTGNPHRNWAEVLDKDQFGSEKAELKTNIKTGMEASRDYPAFLDYMTSLGYACKVNKQSTSFKKNGISFRDTSLGSTYTKAGLEAKWEAGRKDAERGELMAKVAEVRQKNAAKYKKYDSVLVSEWDDDGRHLGFLKRLLLLIVNFVKQISDDYYDEAMHEMSPDNINFCPAVKKLERIEEVIKLLDKHEIRTLQGLTVSMEKAGADMTVTKNEVASLSTFLANSEPIVEDFTRLNEVEMLCKEAGFDLSSIALPAPTAEEIRKNLAELNPITPKLKSRLYSKLHTAPFRLSVPLNDLSEEDGKNILAFLSGTSTTKPPLLLTREEYNIVLARKDLSLPLGKPCSSPLPVKACYNKQKRATPAQFKLLCQLKRAFPEELKDLNPATVSATDSPKIVRYGCFLNQKPETPVQAETEKLDLSILSPELRELVKEYRLLKSTSILYGGIDLPQKVVQATQSLVQKKEDLKGYTATYKELKYMERVIGNMNKTTFVYGSGYPGNGVEFNQSRANLGASDLDRFYEIKKIISKNYNLSGASRVPISSPMFIPPPPEIKAVLRELKAFYPDINPDTITEYDALLLIQDLVEEEAQKEKEKEKER